MKILVFGAGVLGSLYASRLQETGHAVSLLARGQRLAELHEHGLVVESADTGQQTVTHPQILDHLDPEAPYDWAMVFVRKNQLAGALNILAANPCIPNILLMVNNAAGPKDIVRAIGKDRVVLGFPGAGGERVEHLVRYHITSGFTQPTTLGELNGQFSQRLVEIGDALHAAGFPVGYNSNMDAWLKTHVAIVSPAANAIYLAGGDSYRLARTRDGLVLMIRAIREGFRVLHTLGIPITPGHLRVLEWLPEPLLVAVLQRALNTPRAELVMARHANHARDEMTQLAREFQTLARTARIPTPAIDLLNTYLDPSIPAYSDGRSNLPLAWREAGNWALAGIAFLLLGRELNRLIDNRRNQ